MRRAVVRALLLLSMGGVLLAIGWSVRRRADSPAPLAAQRAAHAAPPAASAEPQGAHAAPRALQPPAAAEAETDTAAAGPAAKTSDAVRELATGESPARAPTQRAGSAAPAEIAGDAGTARKAVRRTLDRAGIQSAVRSVLPEVRECYEGWLKAEPSLSGTVRVHMTIERDPDDASHAVVTSSRVLETELEHAAFEGCLLNALSEPEFELPADSGKVEVTYPFHFDTGEPNTQ